MNDYQRGFLNGVCFSIVLTSLIIIIMILVGCSHAYGAEKKAPDFGWWFEPGSPQAAGCPPGQGLIWKAYGTPKDHISTYECDGGKMVEVPRFESDAIKEALKKPKPKKEKKCRTEYELIFLHPQMRSWWKNQSPFPPESAHMTWGEIINEALKEYPNWEIDEKRYYFNKERDRPDFNGRVELWLKRRICE